MAESIGGVQVDITGDYSQLEADFDAAVAVAVDAGKTLAEAIEIASAQQATYAQNSAAATDATNQTAAALVDLGTASGESSGRFQAFAEGVEDWISHPLRMAGEAAKNMILALGPLGTAAVGAAAGFAEVGHAITEMVMEEGKAARETQNLADRLNLSFEETKHLSEMARVVDVDMGVLTRTSMRLADALQSADGEDNKIQHSLHLMGIAAADSGEALLKLLDRLKEIPDATTRIKTAHDIMGRGAVQLEPLLKNYDALSAAVTKLGGELDREGVDKLLKARESANLLDIAWGHLKETLAATFAPAVIAGLNALTSGLTLKDPGTLEEQISKVSGDLARLKANIDGVTIVYGDMGAKAASSNRELIKTTEAHLASLTAQKEAADRSKEYNKEIEDSNAEAARVKAFNADEEKRYAEEMIKYNKMLAQVAKENTFQASMTEDMKIASAQAKIEQSALDGLIQEIAKYNVETGQSLNNLQYFNQLELEASKRAATLGDDLGPVTTALTSEDVVTTHLSNAMEKLAAASVKVQQTALDNDKIHATTASLEQMAHQTVTLGDVYQDLATNVQHAFDRVGNSFATALVKGKGFTDAMKAGVQGLASAIIGTLINAILKMAEQWVLSLILGKATASAVDAGMVTGQAAVAGAAGYASVMASVPFPANVALAPAVAAATLATVIGTYVPIATFDMGGLVPNDMFSMVHGGESVYTASQTNRIEDALSGGGTGGIVVNVSVTGVVTHDVINQIGDKLVYKIRSIVGNKSNF